MAPTAAPESPAPTGGEPSPSRPRTFEELGIPDQFRKAVEDELTRDEKIVWLGRPSKHPGPPLPKIPLMVVGGILLGLAILATIANSVTGESLDPVDLTAGFHDAFLVGAGFGAIGLILALTLIKSSDSRAMIETDDGSAPQPATAA